MDEESVKRQAEIYKVAGVDEDEPALNPVRKRKEAMLEEVRFFFVDDNDDGDGDGDDEGETTDDFTARDQSQGSQGPCWSGNGRSQDDCCTTTSSSQEEFGRLCHGITRGY